MISINNKPHLHPEIGHFFADCNRTCSETQEKYKKYLDI